MRVAALVGLALASAGLTAPAAWAGTVSSRPAAPPGPSGATCAGDKYAPSDCGFPGAPSYVSYAAVAGELNRLVVSRPEPGVLELRDPAGISVTPGDASCSAPDATTARCTVSVLGPVSLGDGADEADVQPGVGMSNLVFASFVDGGPGDDVIRAPVAKGREGADRLTGSELEGGPDADVLTGTDGKDVIEASVGDRVDAGAGDDVVRIVSVPTAGVDAGAGQDRIEYSTVLAPVVADLGGGPGTDALSGVEAVSGTAGADRLLGGDGAETLYGIGGADVVLGRGGDDTLGTGVTDSRALLEGGPGRDTYLLTELSFDVVRCDAGDVVRPLANVSRFWPTQLPACGAPPTGLATPVARGGRIIAPHVPCGDGAGTVTGCRFTFAVRRAGRTIAHRVRDTRPHEMLRLGVPLPASARRAARASRRGLLLELRIERRTTLSDGTAIVDRAPRRRVRVGR